MEEMAQERINRLVTLAGKSFFGHAHSREQLHQVMAVLLLKHASDRWNKTHKMLREKLGDDDAAIDQRMKRLRFPLLWENRIEHLFDHRNHPGFVARIDNAFSDMVSGSRGVLDEVFKEINFNAPALGQRNRKLKTLIADIANPMLDLSDDFRLGEAVSCLLESFFNGLPTVGEHYTQRKVSMLLARLLDPQEGMQICDPFMGTGSTLIETAKHVRGPNGMRSRNVSLYGQDNNREAWTTAKLNFLLHHWDDVHLGVGDIFNNPLHLEHGGLMRFDIVVGAPPMEAEGPTAEEARRDPYQRFLRGCPPKGRGDFAYILHAVETLGPGGRAGLVVPQGVLFRGQREGVIRRSLIEENLIDAVIALPQHQVYGMGVPAAIIIFNKARKTKSVVFIDASKKQTIGRKAMRWSDEDIDRIVSIYRKRESVAKYAYVSSQAQIRNNQFNLSVSRYVGSDRGDELSTAIILNEDDILKLESELGQVRNDIRIELRNLLGSDGDDILSIVNEPLPPYVREIGLVMIWKNGQLGILMVDVASFFDRRNDEQTRVPQKISYLRKSNKNRQPFKKAARSKKPKEVLQEEATMI
ncbi:N-6 DNA methylase [Chryseolinea soli]|uniref:site-specific DNA-methyltransferase (adenine-specific) n=1 Tax=Chryseolinea soli TaxID=2321403 RepID=A0A385SRT4_9BACT|nr:N-6 DNA methylase [Chryseolinea soli]AYB33316.1 type I restriction endonuclease subunit M [Chryseolinea soli]